MSLLETEVDRRKQRTDELEARLISVEKEFENYKVRAQSVLRQAKDKVILTQKTWTVLPVFAMKCICRWIPTINYLVVVVFSTGQSLKQVVHLHIMQTYFRLKPCPKTEYHHDSPTIVKYSF